MRSSNRHIMLDELIEICDEAGLLFEASRSFDLTAGGTSTSLFRTTTNPVILFSREIGYNGVGVIARAYRDPVVTSYGDSDTTVRNPNDLCPTDPTVSLYVGQTLSDVGIETRSMREIFSSESNQSQGAPAQTIQRAHRIGSNKTIVHTIENRDTNSAQHIFAALAWIEPTRIPSIGYDSDTGLYYYKGVAL